MTKTKDSIFGSYDERQLFKRLTSCWRDKVDLFPQVPLCQLVEEPEGLSDKEVEYFRKANTDITVCEKDTGKPLLSIEFDGMGEGFSRQGEYIQINPKPKSRKKKLDFKVKAAHEADYPLIVISYPESTRIEPMLHLTIADGIIGQVLFHKHFYEEAQKVLEEHEDSIPPGSVSLPDFVQQQLTAVQISSIYEFDPLTKLLDEYMFKALSLGVVRKWDCTYPDAPGEWWTLPYLKWMRESEEIRCICVVETSLGRIEKEATIRNVQASGFLPLGLAKTIAELLAFREICDSADGKAI